MPRSKTKQASRLKLVPVAIGTATLPALQPTPEKAPCVEALVDRKRVVVEAEDEMVLQCGKASITLRRNGRVVIRGTYVETSSAGVNRIKGGSVQIN